MTEEIKDAIERERIAELTGWKTILSPTPSIMRMLIVGVGIAVAQQAVGIDAIQYYLLDVLKESGIESEKGQLGALISLGILKLLFVVVGSKLLDNHGRRSLLFVSLLGMCGACILTSISFIRENGSTFAIVGLSLYLSFFSIGMGPVAWLVPSEIFPTSIRAKGMSIATFFNRIVATLMASTFLSTANAISWAGFFLLLACVCGVVFIFVFVLLPETKGRSLEDMALYFAEITDDSDVLRAEKQVTASRENQGAVELKRVKSQKASAATGELA